MDHEILHVCCIYCFLGLKIFCGEGDLAVWPDTTGPCAKMKTILLNSILGPQPHCCFLAVEFETNLFITLNINFLIFIIRELESYIV